MEKKKSNKETGLLKTGEKYEGRVQAVTRSEEEKLDGFQIPER